MSHKKVKFQVPFSKINIEDPMKKGYYIPSGRFRQEKQVPRWSEDEYIWVDSDEEFYATLKFIGSGFTLVCQSTGNEYYMFPSHVFELMQKTSIIDAAVEGVWTYAKIGTDFGIKFVRVEI